MQVDLSKPPKVYHSDASTLFLNNLPYSVTEAMIKEKFPEFQDQIKEIRIIKNQEGQPKGYAYMELANSNAMEKLLDGLKNPIFIEKRRMIVQKADSENKHNVKKNLVVFLKGLSFKAKEKDIREFFEGMPISRVKMVKNKEGNPAGLAYVEFTKYPALQAALDLKEGTIKGRKF